MTRIHRVLLAALVATSLAAPAWAQALTQTDIQRLQDNTYLAERDVTALRTTDSGRANQLQAELDDLKDEVIYLKVKLRKDRTLSRAEFNDVQSRIEDLRTRARSTGTFSAAPSTAVPVAPAPAPVAPAPSAAAPRPAAPSTTTAQAAPIRNGFEVPTGTEMDVRLQASLNSGTAQVEDRFEATTLADVLVNGRVAIPSGAVVRGVVTDVKAAGRVSRTGSMTVSFDQITINGRDYPMRGTVTQAIESEGIKGDVGRGAAGAGVGAVLGALLGGGKGAVLGAIIGGGGTIAATEGKQVELPQGTTLRVRFDSPLTVAPATR